MFTLSYYAGICLYGLRKTYLRAEIWTLFFVASIFTRMLYLLCILSTKYIKLTFYMEVISTCLSVLPWYYSSPILLYQFRLILRKVSTLNLSDELKSEWGLQNLKYGICEKGVHILQWLLLCVTRYERHVAISLK